MLFLNVFYLGKWKDAMKRRKMDHGEYYVEHYQVVNTGLWKYSLPDMSMYHKKAFQLITGC